VARDLPEKWWVRLSLCSSSLPVVPITVTCKKNTNTKTSCLLSFSVFGFRSASVSSLGSVPFLCLISSLSQVAGKEGEWTRGRNGGWEGGWLLWRPICGEMKERTGMAGRSRSGSWFRSKGCWVCRVGRNYHCWGRLKKKKKTAGAAAALGGGAGDGAEGDDEGCWTSNLIFHRLSPQINFDPLKV